MANVPAPDFTQANLNTINEAIATGAMEVRFADRTIRYSSMSDLLKAQAVIKNSLNEQSGTVPVRQGLLFS